MQLSQIVNNTPDTLALPQTSFELEKMINDPASDINDFSDVICVDPTLTSKLLRLANSALYRQRGQVSTVSRAVQVIGVESTYEMTLSELACSAIRQLETGDVNIERFWRMSVFTALSAKFIAEEVGIRDFERLFVSGLMKNIGELLLYRSDAGLAMRCEEKAEDANMLPWEAQHKVLGYTYSDISASLLDSWGIPKQITMPIKHFNQAPELDINSDVKILYLASHMTVSEFSKGKYPYSKILSEKVFQQLGFTPECLKEIARSAKEQTDEIVSILSR